ncbi:stretch-activated cation channel mid1 [Neonectria punicea]|uniref:Stretch-activated cation channel mid1 n=1 Tax=Neonectria punicea TaxID=979145 RepID=A0ABR1GMJ0_9HYPO
MIFVLYLLLFSPSFASATELPVENVVRSDQPLALSDALDISYEPDFAAFDRSIIGRAPPAGVQPMTNNGAERTNLDPGITVCYMIEKSTIFGRGLPTEEHDDQSPELSRRAESKTVYISANTCLQPGVIKNGEEIEAPQLNLYISTTNDIQCPGPSKDTSRMKVVEFTEGAVMHSLNATGNIYIGVSAPNITQNYTGVYNYEIAASLDEYYHKYDSQNGSQLLWMDSDSSSVLLVTRNITQNGTDTDEIMKAELPYDIFMQNNNSRSLDGLRHSVCGLKNKAQLSAIQNEPGKGTDRITTVMTTRGPGGLPKQQFYVVGLDSSSHYSGILVKRANGTSSDTKRAETSIGGGGTVFRATDFQTSSGTNCKVVTDLDFCDEIQYAVPGNDNKYNNTELANVYDNYAKKMYANFEKVLMQISCEAPPQSLYSLARTCDDCRAAYKRWLCTVSIPRCEDFMSNGNFSIPRNVAQAFPNGTKLPSGQRKKLAETPAFRASRNKFIDETIKPGPYKELLPCDDLCYEVVQSCPAAIGFTCPQPGFRSFNVSYGQRFEQSASVTCNYPGEARTKTSVAAAMVPGAVFLSALPLMMWLGL